MHGMTSTCQRAGTTFTTDSWTHDPIIAQSLRHIYRFMKDPYIYVKHERVTSAGTMIDKARQSDIFVTSFVGNK